jgi:hypothetical protein
MKVVNVMVMLFSSKAKLYIHISAQIVYLHILHYTQASSVCTLRSTLKCAVSTLTNEYLLLQATSTVIF